MKARKLIEGAGFPPDDLKVIFEAFDDAWNEVASGVGSDAGAIDTARVSLATIVLSFANARPIDRMALIECGSRRLPLEARARLKPTPPGAEQRKTTLQVDFLQGVRTRRPGEYSTQGQRCVTPRWSGSS